MELKKRVCPNCGANISVDDPSKPIKCSYCGGVFYVDGESGKVTPTVDKAFEDLKKGILHDMSHEETSYEPHIEGKVSNPLAVVAFFFSIFSPLSVVGLILGLLGLKKSGECCGKGRRLSLFVIGLSLVKLAISFLAFLGAS